MDVYDFRIAMGIRLGQRTIQQQHHGAPWHDTLLEPEPLFSLMMFSNFDAHTPASRRRQWAPKVLRKDYWLGDVPLTCWQYEGPDDRFFRRPWLFGAGSYWELVCEPPLDVGRLGLQATYFGQQAVTPAFYNIIEGVTPVK